MKNLNILSILLLLLAVGCKKDTVKIEGASINVVNTALGAGAIKVNPGTTSSFSWSASTTSVAYGTAFYYQSFVGNRTVTVVAATDTTKSLFSQTTGLKAINTLYLIGIFPNIEGMLVAEQDVPYITPIQVSPDSSAYIRFVNLSPNSTSIKVNIKTTPAIDEVTTLSYKGVSAFKKYPAKVTTVNYVFEVRDVTTGMLQLTYTLAANTNRYKTISLVLRGLVGGTGASALAITQVNYFN